MDDDDHDTAAKRRPWGPDEDEHLRQLVQVYGIKSWAQIATRAVRCVLRGRRVYTHVRG